MTKKTPRKTAQKNTAKTGSKSRPSSVKKQVKRVKAVEAPIEELYPEVEIPLAGAALEPPVMPEFTPAKPASKPDNADKAEEKGEEGEDFYLPLPEYDDRYRYVGLQKRLLAQSIDLSLYALIASSAVTVLSAIGLYHEPPRTMVPQGTDEIGMLLILLKKSYPAMLAYLGLLGVSMSCWGTTPARWLMGIRLAQSKDGGRVSLGVSLLRVTVGYAISALPVGLGFFWGVMAYRKQALHDRLFGTVEIADRRHFRQIFKSLAERLNRGRGPLSD